MFYCSPVRKIGFCQENVTLSHSNALLPLCREKWLLSGKYETLPQSNAALWHCQKKVFCQKNMRPPYDEAARSVASYIHQDCQEKGLLSEKFETLLQPCQKNGLLSGKCETLSHGKAVLLQPCQENGFCQENMRPLYGEAARSIISYIHQVCPEKRLCQKNVRPSHIVMFYCSSVRKIQAFARKM